MKVKNFVRQITVLAAVVVAVAEVVSPLEAQGAASNLDVIIRKDQLAVDTSAINAEGNYHQPKTILVTPVFLAEEVKLDSKQWYRGLFYYFSSDRHNYKDIPAHLVLDQNGKLYEGIKGGVERELLVKGQDNSPILIYYLAERGETDFSLSARATLQRQLLKLANENEIKPENIEVAGLKLVIDDNAKQASLTKEAIFGNWLISFKAIREQVAKAYTPTKKHYQVEVVEFKNPANPVKIGSEVVLSVKLKNTGEYTIFSDSDSDLILTKLDGKDSQFFLNNHWVSKTQLTLLPSGTVFLPGAEKSFEFKTKAPFLVGEHAEDFVIKTAGSNSIDNAKLNLKFTIDKGDLKVLEVLSTETGTLNIRRDPFANAPIVAKASPGQRYVWLESNPGGWYKLQLDEGTGWVLGRYVKVL